MQNDLTKELGTNFIEYAVAVNTDRAIPDAKSGLKPVAKRILWSAYEEGRTSSKPHVKAARIVGDVMGKYHPHGDSSIYGAMVRLSQPWVMRYPLIDWHGNNGNIAGDGPAAARYTEARLTKLAEEGLLNGIKKKNVDFIQNYDETLDEPVTLPSTFPNLLCNPNTGIGVAMACNWAPHNLNDVAQAILDFLDGNVPTLPGPDFPTGGLIINKNDIPKIMETGHGSVKIRARYNIEKDKIIFYEIPYGQTIEGLISEVGDKCDKKEFEEIIDIHDESNKKGIRIVIQFKNGSDPHTLARKLYQKTNFQTSFSYNQVALIDKTPIELNLKNAIKIYINHNLKCIIKECEFDLTKAKARLEIVEGLLKALEDIDNIIALIKKSDSAAAAKINLISKYNFTENQAKAILAMKLSSLAKLEKIELEKEAENLKDKISILNSILNSQDEQIKILKARLNDLVKKYGDKRRTELTQIEDSKKEKAVIIPEDVVVVITKNGNIKRVPKKNFKIQKRRGKGTKTLDNAILSALSVSTIDTLLVFSSYGKMYQLSVNNIPEGNNTTKGIDIRTLLPLKPNEEIQAVTDCNQLKEKKKYIFFFTKQGLIKKSNSEDYLNIKRTTGIQALKLKENDELVNVFFLNNTSPVLLITKKGYIIKIPTDDIKATGRVAFGVKGIKLKDGDEVIRAIGNLTTESDTILLTTSKGKGKKVLIKDFIIQGRGGVGVKGISLDPDDFVADAAKPLETSSILIIGKPNSICISASEIPLQSKSSSGVKIIAGSSIISISVL